jgi:hypothetical protein
MSAPLVQLEGVAKRYPYFRLEDVDLRVAPCQVSADRACSCSMSP